MRINAQREIRTHLVLTLGVLVFLSTPLQCSPSDSFAGIKALDGYSVRKDSAVDATTWTIEKKGGVSLHFEAGFSEGMWADPRDGRTYSWTRTQTVNGYKVIFALIKIGLKTHWEPKNDRGLPPGNILLVTFLLDGVLSFHTANFSAKIGNDQELADALLMVMTFDPSKGSY